MLLDYIAEGRGVINFEVYLPSKEFVLKLGYEFWFIF